MSRNIKELMLGFFSLLASRTNIQVGNYPHIRMFVTEEEFNSMSTDITSLSTLRFGYGLQASMYVYQDHVYLIMPQQCENLKRVGLVPFDDMKDLWLVNIVENHIQPTERATENELLTNVFVEEEVEDVEWDVVKGYFPEMTVYRVDDTLPDDTQEKGFYLKRICLELVCQRPEMLLLPYEQKTLNAFANVANSEDNNIPLDNVLRSLMSYQWKFCFIDLYRCHERLFLLAWVDEFQKTMQSGLPLQSLYDSMKNRYQTEHHEDKNIVSLYKLLPVDVLNILDAQQSVDEKAKFIYKIRNKIVHFQKNDEEIENMSDEQWNKVIFFLLSCIPHLYNRLATHICELPNIC